jgi:hypothetical protein
MHCIALHCIGWDAPAIIVFFDSFWNAFLVGSRDASFSHPQGLDIYKLYDFPHHDHDHHPSNKVGG